MILIVMQRTVPVHDTSLWHLLYESAVQALLWERISINAWLRSLDRHYWPWSKTKCTAKGEAKDRQVLAIVITKLTATLLQLDNSVFCLTATSQPVTFFSHNKLIPTIRQLVIFFYRNKLASATRHAQRNRCQHAETIHHHVPVDLTFEWSFQQQRKFSPGQVQKIVQRSNAIWKVFFDGLAVAENHTPPTAGTRWRLD